MLKQTLIAAALVLLIQGTATYAQEAPTGLSINTVRNNITEGETVGSGIKIADVNVIYPLTDPPNVPGNVTFTLSGNDGTSFEMRGNELWFIAGTPDYETKSVYNVTISADDDAVAGSPDVTAGFALPVIDTPEATLAYRYEKDTGFFIGAEKVPVSPVDGGLLLGKNTTLTKPTLPPTAGKMPVWDKVTETWSEVDDHRGKDAWRKADKAKVTVERDNVVKDEWTLLEPPAGEFYEWDEPSGTWVENTVKKDEAAALIARVTALKQDADTVTLATRLENATPEQIETFVTTKIDAQSVSSVAEAKAAMVRIERAIIEILTLLASERQKGAEAN